MRLEVQILPDPPILRSSALEPCSCADAHVASLRLDLHKILFIGAIAQLGEHLLCKQGVVGSIPTGSTRMACGESPEESTLLQDALFWFLPDHSSLALLLFIKNLESC